MLEVLAEEKLGLISTMVKMRVEVLFEALATFSETQSPRLEEPTRGCARRFSLDYEASKPNFHEVPGKISLCVPLEFWGCWMCLNGVCYKASIMADSG